MLTFFRTLRRMYRAARARQDYIDRCVGTLRLADVSPEQIERWIELLNERDSQAWLNRTGETEEVSWTEERINEVLTENRLLPDRDRRTVR